MSAPRALSREQQASIAAALRPFAGQRLNIFVFTTETEIVSIGNQIIAALDKPNGAGWVLSVSFGGMATSRTVAGLVVEVTPSATEKDFAAALALASALSHEGLRVDGPRPAVPLGAEVLMGSLHEDETAQIRIIIARRP